MTAAFADEKEPGTVVCRFNSPEDAKAALEKLNKQEIDVCGTKPTAKLIEGDEEKS